MLGRRSNRGRTGSRDHGFTMIEMIVTMSIFALLVALAVPTMRTWVANTKVRAAADSLQNGIRLAQGESLRRSRQVVFALTNTANPQNGFTAAASGIYWGVQTVPAVAGETPEVVQTGVLNSAGPSITITAVQNQTEICFNSFGRLVTNNSTQVPGGNCTTPTTTFNSAPAFWYDITAAGGTTFRVIVGLGGQLHLCDTNQTFSSSNPYGC